MKFNMKLYEAENLLKNFESGVEEKDRKAFDNWRCNALHFKLPNGNYLSTTWAYGAYTDGYPMEDLEFVGFRSRDTVEVMISCSDKLHKRLHNKFGGDGSVIGHLEFDEWLYIVNALAKEPPKPITREAPEDKT